MAVSPLPDGPSIKHYLGDPSEDRLFLILRGESEQDFPQLSAAKRCIKSANRVTLLREAKRRCQLIPRGKRVAPSVMDKQMILRWLEKNPVLHDEEKPFFLHELKRLDHEPRALFGSDSSPNNDGPFEYEPRPSDETSREAVGGKTNKQEPGDKKMQDGLSQAARRFRPVYACHEGHHMEEENEDTPVDYRTAQETGLSRNLDRADESRHLPMGASHQRPHPNPISKPSQTAAIRPQHAGAADVHGQNVAFHSAQLSGLDKHQTMSGQDETDPIDIALRTFQETEENFFFGEEEWNRFPLPGASQQQQQPHNPLNPAANERTEEGWEQHAVAEKHHPEAPQDEEMNVEPIPIEGSCTNNCHADALPEFTYRLLCFAEIAGQNGGVLYNTDDDTPIPIGKCDF